MTLLLIGFGAGAAVGFVLCAIRAAQQFDEGYRMGMEVMHPPMPDDQYHNGVERWSHRSRFEVIDTVYDRMEAKWK